MKIGDIVRIVLQPKSQSTYLVGERAIIEEMEGGFAVARKQRQRRIREVAKAHGVSPKTASAIYKALNVGGGS
jgi:hypothetical protein